MQVAPPFFARPRGWSSSIRPNYPYPRRRDEGPRAVNWPAISAMAGFFAPGSLPGATAQQRLESSGRQFYQARWQFEEAGILWPDLNVRQFHTDRRWMAGPVPRDRAFQAHHYPLSADPYESL